jgi:hypothetical protein
LRSGDGVYFTKFGARKLAHYVEREIERIGGNKSMPVALPVPDGSPAPAPNAKAVGPAQRPAAGPVVPLTETRTASEELVGGPAAATGAAATLIKGEPLAAPTGRADDFSWPRGAINVEPVAVEPAAPDTAAADAGAKTAKPTQRKSALDAYAQQKPAQRRARPRLNPTPTPWAYQRPSGSSFGPSGW